MSDKKKEYKPTILGKELTNRCPCGTEVAIYERQDVAYDRKNDKFVRVCAECIQNERHFA